MEDTDETDSGLILKKACQNMAKHAAVSSNLAALSLHVTRMLRKLVKDIQQTTPTSPKDAKNATSAKEDISVRISRVGKARATAGALQLLRLLLHSVVKDCGVNSSRQITRVSQDLEEALVYQTRGDIPFDQSTGQPLIHSILDLIVATGSDLCDALQTPEIYDTTVIGVQLLLVLCGTQLYQPFQSSFQTTSDNNYKNYVLDKILKDDAMDETSAAQNVGFFNSSLSSSKRDESSSEHRHRRHHLWTHRSILATCMNWLIKRPAAPEQSIAHYYSKMTQVAVAARDGETLGRDGMYESYMIVHAEAPCGTSGQTSAAEVLPDNAAGGTSYGRMYHQRSNQKVILDATKGVILLGSSIIMLPFRLMSLILGVIKSPKIAKGGEEAQLLARKLKSWKSSRTRDVLWLSDCILADLMTCFVLLLVNNQRQSDNPFRKLLTELSDPSWEGDMDPLTELPNLPNVESTEDGDDRSKSTKEMHERELSLKGSRSLSTEVEHLNVKLDALYDAFGRSLHTEIGALMLYTLYQACPSIAETMVVRSELDRLVLPLLRTLYFSSNTQTYIAKDFIGLHDPRSSTKLDIRSCPFRSLSQLYVIVILLLLFSQDTIFGRDAFRRIRISHVPWYKERNLRNINLGSVVLLTLLRSLLFNLHRLHDPFLLSNCCAVLQNLSSSIVDVHDYTAMRLAYVTVTVMKKHLKLSTNSVGQETTKQTGDTDDFITTPLRLYDEVAQTLLEIIYECLSPKTIERNLHLVYALVYHQADFNRVLNDNKHYSTKLLDRIQSVTAEACRLIQDDGATTASKALTVLEAQVEHLQKISEATKRKKERENIAFTYEEEADPEIFFVPYVWETIVCVVTSGTIEWSKEDIQTFSLLKPMEEEATELTGSNGGPEPITGHFSEDIGEVV